MRARSLPSRSRPVLQRLALASLVACSTPLALAQDVTPHNYWGASIGASNADSDGSNLGSVLPPGVGISSFSSDDKDQAYRLFGGHQFNRYLALEGGYFHLGRFRFDGTTAPAGAVNGKARVQGFNLDVVGTLPISERFSLMGRVGAQYAQSKASYTGTGAAAGVAGSATSKGTNGKVGLGVQYALTPAVWIRGEVERYRVKAVAGQGKHVDTAMLSVVFPFGRTAPMRMAAAPMAPEPVPVPAPMVQAPAPAPMPVVVAPAPEPVAAPAARRVSFEAETLFGFDAVALRPEGKAALDGFGRELQGTTYGSIKVEGHTDRMGSDSYNQTLSTRRADSVKEYLVEQVRLDPARIGASGMGEREPTTLAGACPASMARAQRISCLQPDRRVDVEVTGTR